MSIFAHNDDNNQPITSYYAHGVNMHIPIKGNFRGENFRGLVGGSFWPRNFSQNVKLIACINWFDMPNIPGEKFRG